MGKRLTDGVMPGELLGNGCDANQAGAFLRGLAHLTAELNMTSHGAAYCFGLSMQLAADVEVQIDGGAHHTAVNELIEMLWKGLSTQMSFGRAH